MQCPTRGSRTIVCTTTTLRTTKMHRNAYHTSRSSGNSTSISASTTEYKASSTQLQCNPGAYNWSGQSQQGYSTGNRETQPYGNSGWCGINSQQRRQPAYDFERQQSGHDIPTSADQNFHSSTSQGVTQQSMQRLKYLAHGSGLEIAGRQEGSNATRTAKSDFTACNAHRNTGVAETSLYSPAQPAPQSGSNQTPASTSTSHAHRQSGSSQQDLAASAAAALAGAVGTRKINQQSPALAHRQPPWSIPSMGNAPSRDGCNPHLSHTTASPYVVSTGNLYPVTQQSAQHNRALSSQNVSPRTQCYANTSGSDPSTMRIMTKPQAHGCINDQAQPFWSNRSYVPTNTGQNYSRIVNPATNTGPQETPLPNPQQPPTPSDAMPNFIDPSQVFDPYHKEYEQKKREVAEAEVHRKATEKSPKKPMTGSQIVVPTGSTAPEAPQKTARGKEKVSGLMPPMTSSPQTSTTSQTTLDIEVDMASEMKAMIERMREWKNKDPSMFQKLWEDLKNGGATPSAPPRPNPSPSLQVGQATLPQNRIGNSSAAASVSNVPAVCNTQGLRLPAQLNGYKVIVEDNDEGLPDLGHFPAGRSYRQSYTEKDPNISNERDDGPSKIPVDPSLVQQPATGPQLTPQSLPVRTSRGNTVWPEAKRKALADAAVEALHVEPANRDKGITAQTICDILEQNPSYIDLCKLLEDRGLKLHRGQFARQLLSIVPDLATAQSKAGTEAPSKPVRVDKGPSHARPALTQTTPVPLAPGRPQVYMKGSHPGPMKVEVSTQTAMLSSRFLNQKLNSYAPRPPNNTKPDGTSMSRAVKAHLRVTPPNLSPLTPGSKDALSRKRDFSEFVDLTQLSDDEDYVMPSKQPCLEKSSPEPEVFRVDTDIVAHRQMSTGQPSQGRFTFARSLQFKPHQPQSALATALQTTQRPRAILARPINKSEALRKSYYDPKTVARDILIAAGRHPSERPLNAHLVGLLHRHIELDSDLSTFNWDAVDPGGPPVPRVQIVDIPAGPPKWKLGVQRKEPRNTREDEPIGERLSYQPNAKVDPRPALNSLARLSAQTKHLLQDSQKAANSSRLRHSQLVDDASRDGIGTAVTPQKRKASCTQSPRPSRTRSSHSTSLREPKSIGRKRNMENSGIRRRGRPLGAKNKHPSLTAMKKVANTSPLLSIPSRSYSPPPASFDIYDCQWRKCNAKLHNLATLRRHISKVHRPSTEEAIKLGHTCWWKKCKTLQRNEDRTVTPRERFQSHSEWMDHIDEDHLHPLGMEKGDGPSTAHIGKPQIKPFDMSKYIYRPYPKSCDPLARTVSYLDPQSIAADRATYLSDEHGRAVTAPATRATNNVYPPDALTLAPVSNDAERVPIKQYMRAHGNEKMDLKTSASETLRAMEVKKERVGPGMDRGGCTLVNKERRATLLQNEGIARVVVDDD
jgi:hypothetical protein